MSTSSSLEEFLDKVMTISALNTTKDAAGGIVRAPAPRLSNIPCSVWPASFKTIQQFARPDMIIESEICTAQDISSSVDELVTVDSRTYIVIAYQRFENSDYGGSVYVTVAGKRNQP